VALIRCTYQVELTGGPDQVDLTGGPDQVYLSGLPDSGWPYEFKPYRTENKKLYALALRFTLFWPFLPEESKKDGFLKDV
jgi:hypothetical protein